VNGSQLAGLHIVSATHNTGGMSFGNTPYQTKQRKTPRFSADGVSIISNKTSPKPVRFYMLPGGRWIEETVYHRIMNGNRLDCDPR
jgi:hypothetical protein